MWVTALPGRRARRGRAGVLAARARRAWRPGYAALYQKCVHLGCRVPAVPHLAVVRVPVPRLAVQPRGEKKGGPAPRGLDRFPLDGQRRQRHRRHRRRSSRARRSAPTPPARRPRAPTASAAESTEPMTSLLLDAVLAASTVKAIGVVIAVVTRHRLRRLRPRQHPRRAEPRSAPRSSWRPTASPTTTTRSSRARGSTARWPRGLVLIAVIAVGLPLYWLNEPGRQSGAVENFDQTFVNRGERALRAHRRRRLQLRRLPRRRGRRRPGAAVHAHRRRRRVRRHRHLAGAGAQHRAAPLHARRRCAQILIYGRPGTPMPAWGAEGGGPLTDQQIDDLIAYLGSIQLTSDEAKAAGRGGGCATDARARRGRRDRLGRPGRRRGALQPRPRGRLRGRRLLLRPLPHEGRVVPVRRRRARRTPTSSDYAGLPRRLGRLRPGAHQRRRSRASSSPSRS